jgi:DNA-binding NtrC family response regulator
MPDPTLRDGQPEIPLDAFFERFLERAVEHRGAAPGLRDWVDLAEAWRITHALRACRGNRSAAARALGIGRRTLYSKMEKLGIAPTFSPFGEGA